MAEIRFACSKCGQHFAADGEMAGAEIQCPSCSTQLTVPRPEQTEKPQTEFIEPRIDGSGEKSPDMLICPFCKHDKYEHYIPKPLYGELVCNKCYYHFANRRRGAFIVDVLVIKVVMWALALLPRIVSRTTTEDTTDLSSLAILLFLCKDGFFGQSPGKALMGLQVVDARTGLPAGLVASWKRTLGLLIPFMPFVVAFTLAKGERFGDGWANTRVIWRKHRGWFTKRFQISENCVGV